MNDYLKPLTEVPEGWRLVETNDGVDALGHALTRAGAERLKARFTPTAHLGLRYEVERVTRNPFVFDRWAVVGYQNVLEKL